MMAAPAGGTVNVAPGVDVDIAALCAAVRTAVPRRLIDRRTGAATDDPKTLEFTVTATDGVTQVSIHLHSRYGIGTKYSSGGMRVGARRRGPDPDVPSQVLLALKTEEAWIVAEFSRLDNDDRARTGRRGW
jgi:hypothetical protein